MSTTQAPKGAIMGWGSDAIAQLLRDLGFEYCALVPGASYRGLHDSIVNYLGNERPEMILCLHEEHVVAVAHGWAKITGKPMLAILHSNVGIMHATMAIFNAFCDRMPVLMLGANGPVDAAKRRPWIDWIHSTQDMGALVRTFVKWDDQPGSAQAALESVLRAYQIAATPPFGPTMVVLDAEMQEAKLPAPLAIPSPAKFVPPELPVPAKRDIDAVLAALKGAKHPAIIAGRVDRTLKSWNERIALAEAVNARVITHNLTGSTFPTDHPLHVGQSRARKAQDALREADVILDLDVIDLAGILKTAYGGAPQSARVISASVDRYVHNGWSMDHQALPALDINLACTPDVLVTALVEALGNPQPKAASPNGASHARPAPTSDQPGISIDAFSDACSAAFAGHEVCFTRMPLGVDDSVFVFRHPLDYIGGDGGGGVGSGLGNAVGSALALRGTSRLPVCITGDGDYLMGVQALWTAVHSKIPLLVVVANNRSFYNDEVHQERMAKVRDRPVDRKWIGQRIDDPPPDLVAFARAQGAIGIGAVTTPAGIGPAIAEGIKHVKDGKVCVVEVIVLPEYSAGLAVGPARADTAVGRSQQERG